MWWSQLIFDHLQYSICKVQVHKNTIWLNSCGNNLDLGTGIVDEMIVWGKEAGGSDHEKQLIQFLQATRQHNLKLNLH